jgi:hypothetical protein
MVTLYILFIVSRNFNVKYLKNILFIYLNGSITDFKCLFPTKPLIKSSKIEKKTTLKILYKYSSIISKKRLRKRSKLL